MRSTLILILILFSFICGSTLAQYCGSDAFRELCIENSSANDLQLQNDKLYNYLVEHPSAKNMKTTYTVPIVFHIVHNNGPENVSDATILQCLDELNLQLQNGGGYYTADGNAINIQFCLASVDPFNNPTTGITRDQSTQTVLNNTSFATDIAFKNINRWCPATYLNVWVVADIVGPPAAYGAYAMPNNTGYDGIVIEYPYLTGHRVMAHEVGHYFNLSHTFEGGCLNYNCMLDGDQICDTPPDQTEFGCGQNSCSTDLDDTTGFSPFTTDMPDVANYMDYSSCTTIGFTSDQVARCQATLTQLRPDLLLSNGCGLNPGGVVPNASFYVDSSYCSGTFRFVSTSSDALYTSWDFDGNGSCDGIGADIVHTFASSGYYPVQLLVTGYGGSDTLTEWVYVHVGATPSYPISSFNGATYDPIDQNYKACAGDLITIDGIPGMVSYLWSTGETTPSISFVVSGPQSVGLTAVDQNGLVWGSCDSVVINSTGDYWITTNVGDTVDCSQIIYFYSHTTGEYNSTGNTWFYNGTPVAYNQMNFALAAWNAGDNIVTVTNTDNIGCVVESDTLHYYVIPKPAPTISQAGNVLTLSHDCLNVNWFQDGQVITTVTDSFLVINDLACYYAWCQDCETNYTDTFCVTSLDVGVTEVKLPEFQVFPNPFANQLIVQWEQPVGNCIVRMYNMQGQQLIEESHADSEMILINTENFASGTYLLELEVEGVALERRLVVSAE